MSKLTITNPQDNTRMLSQAARMAQLGYCVFNEVTFKYESVSEEFARIFGYGHEEFLEVFQTRTADMGLVHPEDKVKIAQAYESSDDWDLEYKIVRADGAVRHVHEISESIKDESGNLLRSLCTLQDITERKESEEKLKESERKRRVWLESSPACTKIVDLDLNLQYMSNAGIQGLGIEDVTTLYGKPYPFDFYPESFKTTMVKSLKEARETGEMATQEASVNSLDGEELWFHSTLIPVNDDRGDLDYIMVVSIDITHRRRAEEASRKYSRIVSSTSDMLALLSEDYVFEAANTAYLKKLDTSSEQLIGQAVTDVFNDLYFNTVIKPNAERCLKGETVNFQAWVEYPTEGERFMDMVYSPYTDVDGNIRGIVVGARDVTEQHALEEEVFKSRKLESVGVLAGGIAHDFNNILAGLFGNIELAAQQLPSQHAAHEYIERASLALERATDLTKQLLTFAKGGEPLLAATNLTQLIQHAVDFTLSGSTVKASIDVPEDELLIKADQGQISQVISNLTINAIQAMPDGGTLTIEAENVDTVDKRIAPELSGKFIKLIIRDEGQGISQENLEKIFDPYFTTKKTGSGLGLASVHSIIAKHHGHISVDSKVGVGSCFTIYLPALAASEQEIDAPQEESATKTMPNAGHVLLMDDDEMIRGVSKRMLESFGYDVDTADDGTSAIEKYAAAENSSKPFSVAILDLTIPGGMGGKETVDGLLTINPEAKVIVSSGYSTDPIMAHYADYGFKGRLAKPFLMAALKTELSRVIAE